MSEGDYIEGIYNYCDGWCEKCSKTSRCSFFANHVKESRHLYDLDDVDNEEFWAKLHKLFADTYEMLKNIAKEHDIDISDIEKMEIKVSDAEETDDDEFDEDDEDDEVDEAEDDELFSAREIVYGMTEEEYRASSASAGVEEIAYSETDDKIINSSELIKLCDMYHNLTDDWFKASESQMSVKEKVYNDLIDMDIKTSDADKLIISINDSVDVINWYLYMIKERLKKALYDKMYISDDVDSNCNGSAKVALIGIDRCVVAWCALYEKFDQTEDKILSILLLLSKLRSITEEEFPEARSFIREGLDV